MERISEMNGSTDDPAAAADPRTAFYVTDPATGERVLVREMTDIQLASLRAGVGEVSRMKIKAMLTRLNIVIENPIDRHLCTKMFEDAMSNGVLLMVLEYEQNRRLNAAKVSDAIN